jgi:hypothetical protein
MQGANVVIDPGLGESHSKAGHAERCLRESNSVLRGSLRCVPLFHSPTSSCGVSSWKRRAAGRPPSYNAWGEVPLTVPAVWDYALVQNDGGRLSRERQPRWPFVLGRGEFCLLEMLAARPEPRSAHRGSRRMHYLHFLRAPIGLRSP